MNTRFRFVQGYDEGMLDGDKCELSVKEILKRHPEFQSNEIEAYRQGRMDALMGDDWRYKGIIE